MFRFHISSQKSSFTCAHMKDQNKQDLLDGKQSSDGINTLSDKYHQYVMKIINLAHENTFLNWTIISLRG